MRSNLIIGLLVLAALVLAAASTEAQPLPSGRTDGDTTGLIAASVVDTIRGNGTTATQGNLPDRETTAPRVVVESGKNGEQVFRSLTRSLRPVRCDDTENTCYVLAGRTVLAVPVGQVGTWSAASEAVLELGRIRAQMQGLDRTRTDEISGLAQTIPALVARVQMAQDSIRGQAAADEEDAQAERGERRAAARLAHAARRREARHRARHGRSLEDMTAAALSAPLTESGASHHGHGRHGRHGGHRGHGRRHGLNATR